MLLTNFGVVCSGRDDANIDQILRAAESLDALHGVVIVANGTDPRCTVTVQNTFTRLKNNLPDSVIANTLAVLTNCNMLTKYVTNIYGFCTVNFLM